ISNCGPDVRWVGNEGGFARESEWNVVPKFACDIQTIESNSQQADDEKFAKKGADIISSDLGSRDFLKNFDEFMWYPAEVDVSIRPGWFYHKSQDVAVRSVDNLKRIYYDSVGGNTFLLLNIPPDTKGLIHEKDVKTMQELGEHIRRSNQQLLAVKEITALPAEVGNEIENALKYEYDENTFDPISYYTPEKESDSYAIKITLAGEHRINRIKLVENVAFSQRIEAFDIYVYVNGKRRKAGSGTTVGYGRVAFFRPVVTDCVEIVFTSVRRKPYLEFIGVYEDNGYRPKKPFLHAFKQWIHRVNYRAFIKKENKKNVAK
ncbi:MAG: alpha-L-fucosidase, partial [Clostridia bacterium]|nr:alpha-L-fucosidase [Clostridia bacterium]